MEWRDLPEEVQQSVLRRLDEADLASLARVSRALHNAACDGGLWRELYRRRWPGLYRRMMAKSSEPPPAQHGWKGRYHHQLTHRQVWRGGKRVMRQFPSGLSSLACAQAIEIPGSPPASLLVVCGGKGGLVILDATEGEERFTLSTHDTTTHIAASGATVVRAAKHDQAALIEMLDVEAGKARQDIASLDTPASALHFDGSRVAVADDEAIRLWDCRSPTSLGSSGAVQDLRCERTSGVWFYGHELISSSSDGSIREWDLRTGRCLQTMFGPSPILSMVVDAHNIVCGLKNGSTQVWAKDSPHGGGTLRLTRDHWRCIEVLPGGGHAQPLPVVSISMDATKVVALAADGEVTSWWRDTPTINWRDPHHPKFLSSFHFHRGASACVFSENHIVVAANSGDVFCLTLQL